MNCVAVDVAKLSVTDCVELAAIVATDSGSDDIDHEVLTEMGLLGSAEVVVSDLDPSLGSIIRIVTRTPRIKTAA